MRTSPENPAPSSAPPGGQFNSAHLDQIASAGFSAIRTTELMSLDFPRRHGNLQIMPTTLQSRPQPVADCLRNFVKRRAPRNAILYLRHAFTRDWLAAARNLLTHTIHSGGVFHLWGHSWEIDQHRQWPQLEEIFRAMNDLHPQLPCLTNGDLCLPNS